MPISTDYYLQQALQLAKIRRGFCAPNPAVGAIVVKNNQVIAKGYHHAAGHSHAEVEALSKIADAAQGATVYVTLEPCCHSGKTPPCTDLLIRENVAKVVYGYVDPNPQVAGKSGQILRQAGIECEFIDLPEIVEFYQSYHYWQQCKRPFVTAKIALSLDGKIAGPGGQPVAITGSELQTFTHQQREQSDAILTTLRTIENDNPSLNVRLSKEYIEKPIYILDRELKLPLDAAIWKTAKSITLFHAPNVSDECIAQYKERGLKCVAVADQQNQLSLNQVLDSIGADGVHDLWVEAGGQCFEAFLQQGLLQRAYIYIALKVLGNDAYPAFSSANQLLATVQSTSWNSVGDDAICELRWYNS